MEIYPCGVSIDPWGARGDPSSGSMMAKLLVLGFSPQSLRLELIWIAAIQGTTVCRFSATFTNNWVPIPLCEPSSDSFGF